MQAVKIGLPGFFLPFLFVARPELLLLEGDPWDQTLVTAISLLALAALNVAIVGQGFVRTGWPTRLVLLFAAPLTLIPSQLGTLIGVSIIITTFAIQRTLKAKQTAALPDVTTTT
ncbi:hypothetical protein [Aidingimonas lacisalsi]|uniref:hypothetical protein n=1 Tax=Aidingimonas lacisalsi TaxID=2604086 RepID=UPI0011D19E60|nr:hypothetical protein [Aidingimonas lacisalsi]